MSNLSDLLPAGASAKQLTFTDSGSGIASKKPVILNSDGTVTGVGNVGASFGSADVWTTGSVSQIAAGYDSDNNRVCVVYIDGDNSSYGMAVVGQISGSSITWGTPVTFNSAYSPYPDIDYDTGTNQFVISFVDGGNSNYLGLITAAYAATNSLTFGTKVSGSEYAGSSSVACSSSAFIAVYDTNYGYGIAGTISGTSITLGTKAAYAGGGTYARGSAIIYDTNEAKFLIVTADGSNSNNGYGFVATLSGTSISYGSGSTFNTTSSNSQNLAYDSTAQKSVVMYMDLTATNFQACVGTISGTSVSFGSPTEVLPNYDVSMQTDRNLCYDPASNKTYVTYRKNSDEYGYLLTGTVSGTSISFADETAFTSAVTSYTTFTVDTTSNKLAIVYINSSSTNDGTSKVYSPAGSNLTAQAFVGVADSAISASAAGSIIVQGGTVTGVSSGSGLSAGSLVAFETSGSPSAESGVAFDANAGKMVIAYTYGLNGYAIVGTVSGTSASYGTAVIFQASAAVYDVNAAYDANAQKVVVIYSDGSNSGYPTAIVGTVSGTSISFGTKTAFLSSSTAGDPMSIDYDANAQKVVIGFRDTSNSNYGTGIVGTVSGTSISFGTKTAFNSSATLVQSVVYDSNAQKVAIGYRDAGNSSYGTAVVGTVSGTSISFGSAQVFLSAQTDNLGGCFDSTNNKVVFCYRDTGNSNYGTAIVGTISGTSISFGSSAVYNNGGSTSYNNASYDAGAGKVIISYAQGNAATIAGTVSGTSISFDTAVVLDAGGGMGEVGQAYDSTNAKTLIAFQSAGNSYHGYSATVTFGDIPLTTGTKYYVTSSGGFSSTAGSPSVNAGLAISTTSLLLNGDS